MPAEQTPGRYTIGTAGDYFYNVSVTSACICFLTGSCHGLETALCSVQPLLGCEKTAVEGSFLQEHSSCGGVSEGRGTNNKQKSFKELGIELILENRIDSRDSQVRIGV